MKPVVRWLLVAVLLVAALFVALRPGLGDSGTGSAPPRPEGGAASEAGARAKPDLDALRARAALRPCPAPTGQAVPSGPLAGVVLPCLGAPGRVDLGAALAGRPALLNLWGPLCRPCSEELPALAAYAARPDAVPVLGVEVQDLPEGALDMLATLRVRYPSVSDPEGRLRAALGAPPVLPMSYVVGADGRVHQVNPPEVLRDPERVRAVVARYLGPGAPR